MRVFCPNCDCEDVVKKGFDSRGNQRYFCKKCRSSFVDRSGVPFDEDDLEVLKNVVPITIAAFLAHDEVDRTNPNVKRVMSKLVRCSFVSNISTPEFVKTLSQILGMPPKRLHLMIYEALREVELNR